ncbi:galactan beta-1%2C4-galactosyltransferase GALS1 [Xyrichtys novacula]|uniref:Glycosyltransferase family 92 protein n=1 Tax=Xyrichtys novacula TaxID=13765 RepID=A0AAV1GE18_XYRNO|nr:galactan beta-1%2C4-galactosyltransferase GALS1 [Xyrichtys novacula]
MENKFLKVKGAKTMLVSAFLDHRTTRREVRVSAVVLRKEEAAYHCYLCCDGQLHLSDGVLDINGYHFYFDYGAAYIMCPLPAGCKTASYIAVASDPADSEDVKEFLEVKNQEAVNDSFPYNFTVCMSTMFEFDNMLQLIQSLEMNQLLGVNKVAIYKTSHSPEIKHLLNYYIKKGFVDVIAWPITKYLTVSRSWLPSLSPGEIHYFGQIPALNDCVYRYMYKSKYIVLIDVDELILPQTVNSLWELLPLLEREHGVDECYRIRNTVFPKNIELPLPSNKTLPPHSHWHKVPGVNILAHLYRVPDHPSTEYPQRKFIVNPRVVFSTSVHQLVNPHSICKEVDAKLARLCHTRKSQSDPDQLVFDGRLLNYSAQLISAVNTVLMESGLMPTTD